MKTCRPRFSVICFTAPIVKFVPVIKPRPIGLCSLINVYWHWYCSLIQVRDTYKEPDQYIIASDAPESLGGGGEC